VKSILAFERPDLLKEWDYEKNSLVCAPDEISTGSGKKVWWKCSICQHEWQTRVIERARKGYNCPNCAKNNISENVHKGYLKRNNLAAVNPNLCKEWNQAKNGDLSPNEVTPNSTSKIWWKCQTCGYEWEASIANRNRGSGCPRCRLITQSSFPEQAIFYYCKQAFSDALNKYKLPWRNKAEFDIYIPSIKTAIEYDGEAWHSKIEKDIKKNREAKENGIELVRIREKGCPKLPDEIMCFEIETNDNYASLQKSLIFLFAYLSNKYVFNIPIVNIEADQAKIASTYYNNQFENSIESKNPNLLADWDYEKNNPLTPSLLPSGSNIRVWWKCSKCGYEWKTAIGVRKTRGCPVCANKKVWAGHNDLATVNPSVSKDWNYEKNGKLTPSMVVGNSGKSVWWKCSKCGYEWKTKIIYRNYDHSGCPACQNKTVWTGNNDLATIVPSLLDEWDYEKNIIKPTKVVAKSNKKVWWKCSKCGYEWEARIALRVRGVGCPACSGKKARIGENDLLSKNPELENEWDYKKNMNIDINNILFSSGKSVWWLCPVCNGNWKASLRSRAIEGTGCPYCAGKKTLVGFNDLATKRPDLLEEWDTEKNLQKSITPYNITAGSGKKAWWKCSRCGHEWESVINKRALSNQGCPICRNEKIRASKNKKVICVETNEVFPSITEAVLSTGISRTSITMVLMGKKETVKGYHWKYV